MPGAATGRRARIPPRDVPWIGIVYQGSGFVISNTSGMITPGKRFPAGSATAIFRQRFTPASSNLLFLSWGECEVPPGGASGDLITPGQEVLLFMWKGSVQVRVA